MRESGRGDDGNSDDEDSLNSSSSSSTAGSPAYLPNRSSANANPNYSIVSDSSSPFAMSPWNSNPFSEPAAAAAAGTGLIGSLVREDGHIYSLAAVSDLLYTGSDSKNIRVWKNQKEFSAFKSTSGLVKAIVVSSDGRVFTGHQDGKVRIWRASPKNPRTHKRAGTLPRLKDCLKTSINPSSLVEPRRRKHRKKRHVDAVSALCLSEDQTLLYSGSWDRTFKVWRLADSKCVESVSAHDDAVNSLAVGPEGTVFTGSADGTVKVWRKEDAAKGATRHAAVRTLLRQECAVTALAVSASTLYCGSSDGAVKLWELRGLTHGGELRGHRLAVLCLAAAGSLLFTGSADKTICVWGRDAGGGHVCLSVLTGHGGPVKCLAAEADPAAEGRRWILYSGSLDKSVKVWKVSDEAAGDRHLQHHCSADEAADSVNVTGPPKYDIY